MAKLPWRPSCPPLVIPAIPFAVTVALYIAFATPATVLAGQEFTGRVVGVVDGDTIDVLRDSRAVRVRLQEIDCPEKGQAFGTRAKQFTSELAFRQTVTVQVKGLDRNGRTLGQVMLPDGRSLNRELVRAGLAWWFRKYSTDASLEALEAEARAARRGLWADPNPIAPWEWRAAKTGKKTAEIILDSPIAWTV